MFALTAFVLVIASLFLATGPTASKRQETWASALFVSAIGVLLIGSVTEVISWF